MSSDPEDFREKIKSIGQVRSGSKSAKRHTLVIDEDNPKRAAGQHIEHWDGRQDAIAYPVTAHVNATVKEGKDG